jgi:putative hydrolase of the HAD superfamily
MTTSAVLFDLDNTLYPASSGLMKSVDTRITEYVQKLLGIDLEEAQSLRKQYFADYGTTLRGLEHHHQVDAEDYLTYVHDVAMESFLASDAELDRLLSMLTLTKAIFTNAPAEYARRVLRALGIERHFERVFDIRFSGFRPKPDPAVYDSVLAALDIAGPQAVLIEDTWHNLIPARALGMTTILVGSPPADTAALVADHIVPDILAAMRVVLDGENPEQDDKVIR